MEYEVRARIPGLTLEDEQAWERVIEWLERDLPEYGPVLAFDDGIAEITTTIDAETASGAANIAHVYLRMAFSHLERNELWPSIVDVSPIDEPTRDAGGVAY